jgi:hypothetical protein
VAGPRHRDPGRAQTVQVGGERFGPGYDGAWIRLVPERIVSWGIDPAGRRAAG